MRVVVLGCGYVGLAVGRRLRDAGHAVTGVRRSDAGLGAIRDAGLDAHRADVTAPGDASALPDADWLVFAASAGRGPGQSARSVHVTGLATVLDAYGGRVDPPDRLVYTSSTGVYGDHGGAWVDEGTPPRPAGPRGELLLEAESVATDGASARGIDGTVLRLGGLYGPDRYGLERYLRGPVTAGHRNSTHRDDAAGAIAHVLEDDVARGETVLAVDDEPVDRWAFADWLAERCGVEAPPKVTVEDRLADDDLSPVAAERLRSDKRCRNARLRGLGYELAVPTVWVGYRPAVEAYRTPRS